MRGRCRLPGAQSQCGSKLGEESDGHRGGGVSRPSPCLARGERPSRPAVQARRCQSTGGVPAPRGAPAPPSVCWPSGIILSVAVMSTSQSAPPPRVCRSLQVLGGLWRRLRRFGIGWGGIHVVDGQEPLLPSSPQSFGLRVAAQRCGADPNLVDGALHMSARRVAPNR